MRWGGYMILNCYYGFYGVNYDEVLSAAVFHNLVSNVFEL